MVKKQKKLDKLGGVK